MIKRPPGEAEIDETRTRGDYIYEKTASYQRFERKPMSEAASQVFENRQVRLMQARSWALTQKDVKNEGCTVYVYENTFKLDKMCTDRPIVLDEIARVTR